MSGGHPFHPGELAAQMRFNHHWDESRAERLGRLVGCALDEEKALFAEGCAFFFLATADADGHCDCSFKGTDPDADGRPAPAVWVAEPRRLLFPDYPGNRMFNSIGNILVNPRVGMLFIDFATQTRLRVNGAARLTAEAREWQPRWPGAVRAVEVTVDQVYWNCPKRIPRRP